MAYRKFVYKKLIRDEILQDMIKSGEKPDFHRLTDDDFRIELINKLTEETKELGAKDSDILGELADLQEVIDSLLLSSGHTKAEIIMAQQTKRDKFGSFNNRVFVDTVEIPDDNKWISYLEKHPKRYPEMT
jgi:predicted house-cleaning noncanonical NTP pyrophosphatase (MazG superfamily)